MIIVAGKIDVAPDTRDRYLELRRAAVVATLSEPGCHEFAFSADIAEPGRIRVFEIWESAEALAQHQELRRSTPPDATSTIPVIARHFSSYEVSEERPLPD